MRTKRGPDENPMALIEFTDTDGDRLVFSECGSAPAIVTVAPVEDGSGFSASVFLSKDDLHDLRDWVNARLNGLS